MITHEVCQRARKIFHFKNAFPWSLSHLNLSDEVLFPTTAKPHYRVTSSHKGGYREPLVW